MVETGLIAIGAGLAIGVTAIAAAIAEKEIGAAAVGAMAEKSDTFGKGLILTVIPENACHLRLRHGIPDIAAGQQLRMGLEKVKESVLADADQKARDRVKAAESEARRILSLAKKQASQSEKSFNGELAEEAEMLAKRESASSKLESKKMNLAFRKEFADEIF